jgi:hypothetical protein
VAETRFLNYGEETERRRIVTRTGEGVAKTNTLKKEKQAATSTKDAIRKSSQTNFV